VKKKKIFAAEDPVIYDHLRADEIVEYCAVDCDVVRGRVDDLSRCKHL